MTSVGTGTRAFKLAERINIQQLCVLTLPDACYTILSDILLRRAAVLAHWVIQKVPTQEKGSYQDFGDERNRSTWQQRKADQVPYFAVYNAHFGAPISEGETRGTLYMGLMITHHGCNNGPNNPVYNAHKDVGAHDARQNKGSIFQAGSRKALTE